MDQIPNPLEYFTFYPIQRIPTVGALGTHHEDLDLSIFPFEIGDGLTIEDISPLIADNEFEVFRSVLSKHSHQQLSKIKYAIVHRQARYEIKSGEIVAFESDLVSRSRTLVRETAACLRLIRPMPQRLQLFHGRIDDKGNFYQIGFEGPMENIDYPLNQQHFWFRTRDAHHLRYYRPLFREAMNGPFWKFRMAVMMHESGCFQNDDWKSKFFLWTAALESLFTSQGSKGQNSGSMVASERIRFFLGSTTSVYPEGELSSMWKDPGLTVGDVIGEIYCLRNHLAHGDRVPDWYFQTAGRPDFPDYNSIPKCEVLREAVSFIVRHSLLKILKDGLLAHFADSKASEAYFVPKALTRSALQKAKVTHFVCPT